MLPTNALLMAANQALGDPAVRDQVRQLHAQNAPLLDMVSALGLDASMSNRIREILSSLAPDVVLGIRQATLDMLDRGETAMPVECTVTDAQLDAGTPVVVDVSPENSRETIHVRPLT